MSRSDELPPDQRAALSLLLQQRKTHADVAALLHITEAAVHDRAHAALIMLAPREARGLTAEEREEIGEYLLGQMSGSGETLRVHSVLTSSGAARGWALAVARELQSIAGPNVPEIPPVAEPAPAEAAEPEPQPEPQAAPPVPPTAPSQPSAQAPATPAAPAQPPADPPSRQRGPRPQRPVARPAARASGKPPARPPRPVPVSAAASAEGPPWEAAGRALPSSRLGGGLLLALLVAGIVVAIILLADGGGGSKHGKTKTTPGTSSGPKVEGKFTLSPPESTSSTTGVAEILAESGRRALYVQAEHIPSTSGFFYAIWLYNSHSSAQAVGRSPDVGKTHTFSGAIELPSNASEFKEILITKETDTKPTRPGHVVLRGPFSVK